MSQELSYISGFLDGEGTFTCDRLGRIRVICENTFFPVIYKLQDVFGGSVCKVKSTNPKWKPMLRWVVADKKAHSACVQLLPYLLEKAPQAQMCIWLAETFPGAKEGRNLLPEVVEERQVWISNLRVMKHAKSNMVG